MTFAARPSTIVYRVIDPIQMTSQTVDNQAGGDITYQLYFYKAGYLVGYRVDNGNSGPIHPVETDWYIPRLPPFVHYVRLTVTAGTSPTTGATGTWRAVDEQAGLYALWTWFRSAVGTTTATITLEISANSSGTPVLATKTGVVITVIRT